MTTKRNGLKVFRVRKNLYQAEIAEKLNTSKSNYSLIESGKRNGGFKFWNALQSEINLTDEQIEKLKDGKEI